MADDLELPATGATVATDELTGGRHAQLVKLLSGADGSDQPLVFTETGGIQAGAKTVQVLALITPEASGGYDAGDCIGDPVLIEDVPAGLYQIVQVGAITASGNALPDLLVYGYGNTPAATPTLQADSDVFVPDLGGGGSGQLSVFTFENGFVWTQLLASIDSFRTCLPTVPLAPVVIGSPTEVALVDLWLGVVAAEATAVDLTGGPLIISLTLIPLGGPGDATSYSGGI